MSMSTFGLIVGQVIILGALFFALNDMITLAEQLFATIGGLVVQVLISNS